VATKFSAAPLAEPYLISLFSDHFLNAERRLLFVILAKIQTHLSSARFRIFETETPSCTRARSRVDAEKLRIIVSSLPRHSPCREPTPGRAITSGSATRLVSMPAMSASLFRNGLPSGIAELPACTAAEDALCRRPALCRTKAAGIVTDKVPPAQLAMVAPGMLRINILEWQNRLQALSTGVQFFSRGEEIAKCYFP
jgi:hypothetical protein